MGAEVLLSKEKLQNSEILIIGGEGYIGTAIEQELLGATSFYSPSIEDLDITQADKVAEAIRQFQGETVILAAGITDVAGIEEKDSLYEKALRVNYEGAKNVAEACAREGKRLIFIATGYERAGSLENPGPYSENDPLADETKETELLGRYAHTKLLGDRAVRGAFGNDFSKGLAVVFIDYPCGAVADVGEEYQRPYYLQTLLTNKAKGFPAFEEPLTITAVKDIARAVRIINQGKLTGVFNVAAKGITSPYELLRYMMEKLGEDPNQVAKGSMIEYKKGLEEKGKKLIWPLRGGFRCEQTEKALAGVEPGFSFLTWKEVIDQSIEGPGGLREFWQKLNA